MLPKRPLGPWLPIGLLVGIFVLLMLVSAVAFFATPEFQVPVNWVSTRIGSHDATAVAEPGTFTPDSSDFSLLDNAVSRTFSLPGVRYTLNVDIDMLEDNHKVGQVLIDASGIARHLDELAQFGFQATMRIRILTAIAPWQSHNFIQRDQLTEHTIMVDQRYLNGFMYSSGQDLTTGKTAPWTKSSIKPMLDSYLVPIKSGQETPTPGAPHLQVTDILKLMALGEFSRVERIDSSGTSPQFRSSIDLEGFLDSEASLLSTISAIEQAEGTPVDLTQIQPQIESFVQNRKLLIPRAKLTIISQLDATDQLLQSVSLNSGFDLSTALFGSLPSSTSSIRINLDMQLTIQGYDEAIPIQVPPGNIPEVSSGFPGTTTTTPQH